MPKFSNKFKKPFFWPILPIFGVNVSFEKIQLCHTQHHMGLQHHAEFQKKLMSQSKENFRMEGWKHGQTPIHRTLPTMGRGLK